MQSRATSLEIRTPTDGGMAQLKAVIEPGTRRILWQGSQNLAEPIWKDLALHTVAGTVDTFEVPIGSEARFFRVRLETEELADPLELRSIDGLLDITL